MADVSIVHAFILSKPESPDPSIVSNQEWNAPNLVSGGISGQLLMRDGNAQTGASYMDGAGVERSSDAFSGSATTTPAMAVTTVSCNSNAYILVQPHVNVTLAVGNSAIMSIRRNGAVITTGAIRADGAFYQPFNWLFAEVPGSYAYDILLMGSSGAITNASVVLTALRLGRL